MNNQFRFKGTLGKDSETTFTNNGSALTKFSIAVSDGYKDKQGNWIDVTDWFDVTIWKELSLSKGDRVIVSGKVKKSKVEDKYFTNFIANEVDLLVKREKSETDMETKVYKAPELTNEVPF